MRTNDIITAVQNLKARGIEFLSIPDTYYENLKKGLAKVDIKVIEDIEVIQKL